MTEYNIAVYIDGDSISYKYLEQIIKEINLYGNILINNVYADWSMPDRLSLLKEARNYGITTIQADLIRGKNSTDIKLAVDVMRTLFHFQNIDIYYLVVSDFDYRHLIPEIKSYGKKIKCIGNEHTNKGLISMCDEFILVNNIINQISNNKDINHKNSNNENISKSIIQLIESSKNTDLNKVKLMLQRTYKFDIRNTKYQTFKKYLLENYSNIINISNCSKAIVTIK
jgi:uncharacterized protein (TIGR00288 family)